ncbi:hypothetical protein FOZ62_027216, partial [Perkinsus olseni]
RKGVHNRDVEGERWSLCTLVKAVEALEEWMAKVMVLAVEQSKQLCEALEGTIEMNGIIQSRIMLQHHVPQIWLRDRGDKMLGRSTSFTSFETCAAAVDDDDDDDDDDDAAAQNTTLASYPCPLACTTPGEWSDIETFASGSLRGDFTIQAEDHLRTATSVTIVWTLCATASTAACVSSAELPLRVNAIRAYPGVAHATWQRRWREALRGTDAGHQEIVAEEEHSSGREYSKGKEFALGTSKVFFRPQSVEPVDSLLGAIDSDLAKRNGVAQAMAKSIMWKRIYRQQCYLRTGGRLLMIWRRRKNYHKWFYLHFIRLAAIIKFIRSRLLPSVYQKRRMAACKIQKFWRERRDRRYRVRTPVRRHHPSIGKNESIPGILRPVGRASGVLYRPVYTALGIEELLRGGGL